MDLVIYPIEKIQNSMSFISSIRHFAKRVMFFNEFRIFIYHEDIQDKENYYDFFFNTSSLEDKNNLEVFNKISKLFPIIDFSETNIKKILERNEYASCIFFPILFNKDEMTFYKQNSLNDVGIVGKFSIRIDNIMKEFENRGIKCIFIDENENFVKKNEGILNCKILLNVHESDEMDIFKFNNFSIPIFNSQIIISELCIDNIDEKIKSINDLVLSKVVFIPFEKLVKETCKILNDLSRYSYYLSYEELEMWNEIEIKRIEQEFFKLLPVSERYLREIKNEGFITEIKHIEKQDDINEKFDYLFKTNSNIGLNEIFQIEFNKQMQIVKKPTDDEIHQKKIDKIKKLLLLK